MKTGLILTVFLTACGGVSGDPSDPSGVAAASVYRESPNGADEPILTEIPVPAGAEYWVPVEAGAASVFVTVFSGAVGSPLPPETYYVEQTDDSAGDVQKRYSPTDFPDWVPLSPKTTLIGLANFGPTITAMYSVTFGPTQ